ncbi:MAG: hypothetical protein ABW224_13065 [Kibdelosporangium sp.]
MPPSRRRPVTPSSRRPKVAGLRRRPDHEQPEDEATEPAEPTGITEPAGPAAAGPAAAVDVAEPPELDGPVIGDEPEPEANGGSRPAPKRRDTGILSTDEPELRDQDPAPVFPVPVAETKSDPDNEPESGTAEAGDPPEIEAAEQPRPASQALPVALVVLALLLGFLGLWFLQQESDARIGSGNDALADVDATKDVVGAAQLAVTNVLSYKFDDMQASTTRAKDYLDGEAVGQYDTSMKALEKEIQDQKLQVVVNPVSIGVVRLAGDDARVLVFADQIGARADKQPSGGPTQFAMDMHRTGGKWKIVKLDFFENR